jgi:GNAT superfamily N-acetyltransferase
MNLASLNAADLPAVWDLLRDVGRSPRLSPEWLAHCTLGDPTSYPELRLLAWEDGALVGLCLACLRGGEGVVKFFAVREGQRRLGLATRLFGDLEARLRARGVTQIAVKAVAPNYLAPGVDITYTDAVCFLLNHGFKTDRNAIVDMTVDLAHADLDTHQAEHSLAQEGIVLRRAQAREVPAVAAFAAAEFSMDWQLELAEAQDYHPVPLFVAMRGDEVLSFAAIDVTGPARFGPTGTRKDLRGRGLGGALLRLSLRALRDRGEATADIGWVGPLAFYARTVGAQITRAFWRFEKTLAP